MILSFHPCIEADLNIICAGRDPSEKELSAIKKAKAVILPQGCRESLYKMANENCHNVFPNYDALFEYPGKTGQARLFKKMNVCHPKTYIYETLDIFYSNHDTYPINFPFVFKFSWGGEGNNVYLIDSDKSFSNVLELAKKYECTGQKGFVIQEYIPNNSRTLRAVIIGSYIKTYWKVQQDSKIFYSNIGKGAVVEENIDKDLQKQGADEMLALCEKTGINLAGFDFLFDESKQKYRKPLFLEINYFFGRTGLGGIKKYYQLLNSNVKKWIKSVDK